MDAEVGRGTYGYAEEQRLDAEFEQLGVSADYGIRRRSGLFSLVSPCWLPSRIANEVLEFYNISYLFVNMTSGEIRTGKPLVSRRSVVPPREVVFWFRRCQRGCVLGTGPRRAYATR